MAKAHTIPVDDATRRFYQGVAAGNRVREEHDSIPFPDHESRVRFYWFYCGALAAGEYGCQESDEFSNFVLGAATRAPQEDQ